MNTSKNPVTSGPQEGGAAIQGRPPQGAIASLLRLAFEYGMIIVLIVVLIVAVALYPGFLAPRNIVNILAQNAPIGIVAVGMTFVLISAGFDLSVGSIVALGAVVFAHYSQHGGSVVLAGAITIAAGILCGATNGVVITRLHVNPFVATLGTGSAIGGFAFLYSHSAPIAVLSSGFAWLGSGEWLGINVSIFLLIAAFTLGWIVLSKTVYGRAVFAVGGNDEAARLAGLRVATVRGSTYVLTGACSGLGGMILASRLGVGQADIAGNVALDAIAIVVIGGTSLLGGEGAMWRTIVGLLIIASLNNLFDSLALDSNWQGVVKGFIIVGAVALDQLGRARRTTG